MLFAILTTNSNYIGEWITCFSKNLDLNYEVIDISVHNWMQKCLSQNFDMYILRPPGITNLEKQMFDERVTILSKYLNKPIYPSLDEVMIYENKKLLAYWLQAKGVNSPRTAVFYRKQDAIDYVANSTFPLVAKTNIGASGKGVRILKSSHDALKYVRLAFGRGIKPYIGPNFRVASLFTKLKNIKTKKGLLQKRFHAYVSVFNEPQKYVIFQDFMPHKHEWRVVVIGDSYFAHKKIVTKGKASGSLIKGYDDPPLDLLSFVRDLALKTNLSSVSIDIFDTKNGYMVNEIQTYFGQSDLFQMKVKGVIGRYRYINSEWVFEPGDFASNQCYDLRLEHVLQILNKRI